MISSKNRKKFLLSLAGFDPTGEAGILRDVKVFYDLGFPGGGLPTSLTVQNSNVVFNTYPIDIQYIRRAAGRLEKDIYGIKTGMLYSVDMVDSVIHIIMSKKPKFLVVDPIIKSSSGYPFIGRRGLKALKNYLFPLATVITPNFEEARELTGEKNINNILDTLREMGPKYIIVTGGESGDRDILYIGKDIIELKPGVKRKYSMHGSGCTHSAALLSFLCSGMDILDAAIHAKKYVEDKITIEGKREVKRKKTDTQKLFDF